MRCEVCQREFHSPCSELVSVCSRCIVRGATAPKIVSERSEPSPDDTGEPPGFVGAKELIDLFPDFEIGERLGAGGMGIVFHARQKSLDRPVAIKVLNPRLQGDPEFEERFEREAKAMAVLGHPNIIGIHDFGVRGPYHFLVMEYVEGSDLQKLIRSGSLDSVQAFSIIRQICDALHYAHKKGVIHRDIKPGNILVDRAGIAKVGDFGLARILHPNGDVSLTMTSAGMGTPAYTAPEQLDDARSSDARSDIFAFGVVVYEMLTGNTPSGDFPPPTSRLPRRNRRLDQAVLQAMDHDPKNRLSDLREISRIVAKGNRPEIYNQNGRLIGGQRLIIFLLIALFLAGAGWFAWSKRGSTIVLSSPSAPNEISPTAPPSLEKLLPESGLRGTDEYERMRRRGGVLRRWSEMPGVVDIEAASGIDDFVYVKLAPRIALSWYAARSNGEMISSQPGLSARKDYRRVTRSFFIKWPDRLVAFSERDSVQLLEPTPRAADLTQIYSTKTVVILTPEGRIDLAATDSWVKSHRYVIDRLGRIEDGIDVKSRGRQTVALTARGKAISWIDHLGFFNPPEDSRKLVQVSPGHLHLIGLYEDGTVVTWCHPELRENPQISPALTIPPDLGPIIRVQSFDFTNAAQRPDGSWIAWGDDGGSGIIERINSIGTALDFEFFYVNDTTGTKMIWIEPASIHDEEASQDSPALLGE